MLSYLHNEEISLGFIYGKVSNYAFARDILNAQESDTTDEKITCYGIFAAKRINENLDLKFEYLGFNNSGFPEIYHDRILYSYNFFIDQLTLGFEIKLFQIRKIELKLNLNLSYSYVFYHVEEYFYPQLKINKIRDEFYFGTVPGIMLGYRFDPQFAAYFEYTIQILIENNQLNHYGNISKILMSFSF